MVVVTAVRLRGPPSQLLMPLVFGAHCGSMLALTGTPVNVLVLEASLEAGREGSTTSSSPGSGCRSSPAASSSRSSSDGRFSRTARVACRRPTSAPTPAPSSSSSASTGLHQLRVPADSPSSGSTGGTRHHRPRRRHPRYRPRERRPRARLGPLSPDDVLVVRGEGEATAALATELGLRLRDDEDGAREIADHLFNRASGLAEVVIPPRSPLVGERLFPGMVTPSGNLIVLAVQRQSQDLKVGEPLAAGDTMLLQGTWAALDRTSPPPRFSS